MIFGGGLAVLHRADIQVDREASLLTEDTSVTAQALTPPAHGGFSGSHLQVKVKCLPLSTPQGVSSRRQLPRIHLLVGTKER